LALAAMRRRKNDLVNRVVTQHTAKPKELIDSLSRDAEPLNEKKKQPSARELYRALTGGGIKGH